MKYRSAFFASIALTVVMSIVAVAAPGTRSIRSPLHSMAFKNWKPDLPRPSVIQPQLLSGLSLVFEAIEPAISIENRPSDVKFALYNGSNRSVSGWVTIVGQGADRTLTQDNESLWRVADLAPNQTARGVVRLWANNANQMNRAWLYFFDHFSGEFGYGPALAEAFQGYDSRGRFVFSLDTVKCENPRAKQKDTDFAVLSALDNSGQPGCAAGSVCAGKFLGDFGAKKEKPVGLSLPPVDVLDTDPWPTFHIDVLNDGNNGLTKTTEATLDKISAGARDFLKGWLPNYSKLWDTADSFTQWIDTGLPDCDGMVLGQGVAVSPITLLAQTADPVRSRVVNRVGPIRGSTSMVGCGRTSNYSYQWSFERKREPRDVLYLTPAFAQIPAGRQVQFTPKFGAPGHDVTWHVDGGVANGTISAQGLFTPPSTLDPNLPYITLTARGSNGADDGAHAYVSVEACASNACSGKCGWVDGCGAKVDCGACGTANVAASISGGTLPSNRVATSTPGFEPNAQRAACLTKCSATSEACLNAIGEGASRARGAVAVRCRGATQSCRAACK